MGKRRTHEQFIEEMKTINPNVEILGEFKKVKLKVRSKCLVDGHIWDATPKEILRGIGCPKCAKRIQITDEDFIKKIKNNKNPNIEILGEYIDRNTKIKCKCLVDGYIWDTMPYNIINGRKCPKCSKNIKKTHEEFVNEMNIKNPNIKILGEYITVSTKIKCECLIDGYIYETTPKTLLQGAGCPKCAGNIKRTHEEFIKEVKKINPKIEILGKYINGRTKVKCKCLVDGHIWEVTSRSLTRGKGCPKCHFNKLRDINTKTHDEFIKEMNIKNTNIKFLSKYINSKTKIKCECLICRHIWNTTPETICKGSGCPKCKSSKGEAAIEKYCKNSYLQYKIQYRIDKCKYKRHLPFDFALFNKNKLITLIEYQGEQHYKPVDFAGKGEEWAKKQFKINKNRDEIKRNYCISNNIPLIEIPYWIDDVEGYLEEQMDKVINKPLQLSLI